MTSANFCRSLFIAACGFFTVGARLASAGPVCAGYGSEFEVTEPGFLWWDGKNITNAHFGGVYYPVRFYFGKSRYCVDTFGARWIRVGAPYHETKWVWVDPYLSDVWLYWTGWNYPAASAEAGSYTEQPVPSDSLQPTRTRLTDAQLRTGIAEDQRIEIVKEFGNGELRITKLEERSATGAAIHSVGSRAYIAFATPENHLAVMASDDGENWTPRAQLNNKTRQRPALANIGEWILLFYIAEDGNHHILASSDGAAWTEYGTVTLAQGQASH
jgi:hypothetical protein